MCQQQSMLLNPDQFASRTLGAFVNADGSQIQVGSLKPKPKGIRQKLQAKMDGSESMSEDFGS